MITGELKVILYIFSKKEFPILASNWNIRHHEVLILNISSS